MHINYTTQALYIHVDGPESGDVRFSDSSKSYGQVEVFMSGRWQPVADSTMTWTLDNAEVVCRQLGYAPNGMFVSAILRSIFSSSTKVYINYIKSISCLLTTDNNGLCFLASTFSTNFYFGSTVFSQIDNVNCNGTESKLTHCPHSIVNRDNYTSPQVKCTRSKFVVYNFSCPFNNRGFAHVLHVMYCVLHMASSTCYLLPKLLCSF